MSAHIKHMVDSCTDKDGMVDLNMICIRYHNSKGKGLIDYKLICDYIKENNLTAVFTSENNYNYKHEIYQQLINKKINNDT